MNTPTTPTGIALTACAEPGGEAFAYESLAQHNPPDLTLYVNSRCDIHLHLASRVAVVEGALTNDNMLDRAMKGVDTVVSFLVRCSNCSSLFKAFTDGPVM